MDQSIKFVQKEMKKKAYIVELSHLIMWKMNKKF